MGMTYSHLHRCTGNVMGTNVSVFLLQIIQTPGLWEKYGTGTDKVKVHDHEPPSVPSCGGWKCRLV
jgi:hypothetical protein